jgi:flagellar biosynthesis/type III secretory pathway M-ring protein FliF/YscJ
VTLADNLLKVSTDSVEITSVAGSGGALIALIAIVCLYLVLKRRHNRSETEAQIEEFDLAIEQNEEEEFDDEDEDVFDLGDNRGQTNSNALSESESDDWVRSSVRGGNDLRMDFDDE